MPHNTICLNGCKFGCPIDEKSQRQQMNFQIRTAYFPVGSLNIPYPVNSITGEANRFSAIYAMRRPSDGQTIDYATYLLLIEALGLTDLNKMFYNVLAANKANPLYLNPNMLADCAGLLYTQNMTATNFAAVSGSAYFIDFIDFSHLYVPCP